jgi:hypothetical protein
VYVCIRIAWVDGAGKERGLCAMCRSIQQQQQQTRAQLPAAASHSGSRHRHAPLLLLAAKRCDVTEKREPHYIRTQHADKNITKKSSVAAKEMKIIRDEIPILFVSVISPSTPSFSLSLCSLSLSLSLSLCRPLYPFSLALSPSPSLFLSLSI